MSDSRYQRWQVRMGAQVIKDDQGIPGVGGDGGGHCEKALFIVWAIHLASTRRHSYSSSSLSRPGQDFISGRPLSSRSDSKTIAGSREWPELIHLIDGRRRSTDPSAIIDPILRALLTTTSELFQSRRYHAADGPVFASKGSCGWTSASLIEHLHLPNGSGYSAAADCIECHNVTNHDNV